MREDTLHESFTARVLAPILVLANLGMIVFLAVDGASALAFASFGLSFVAALVLLVRTRRPMHTWPQWLFTRKA